MAFIGALLGVIGAGISAAGSIGQARQTRAAGAYNADIAKSNARIALMQGRQDSALAQNQARWLDFGADVARGNAQSMINEADSLRESTEETLHRRRDDYRRILSRQRSQFAKSGVSMAGTPMDVIAESAGRLELEAQEIARQSRASIERGYYNAALARAGASALDTDASLARWRSKNSLLQGNIRAQRLRQGADLETASANNRARTQTISGIGGLAVGASNFFRDIK